MHEKDDTRTGSKRVSTEPQALRLGERRGVICQRGKSPKQPGRIQHACTGQLSIHRSDLSGGPTLGASAHVQIRPVQRHGPHRIEPWQARIGCAPNHLWWTPKPARLPSEIFPTQPSLQSACFLQALPEFSPGQVVRLARPRWPPIQQCPGPSSPA
jgi:hypothetical protein